MKAHWLSPQQLSQWFLTPRGQQFVRTERALVEQCVRRLFGAQCAIASVYDSEGLFAQSPCRRVYHVVSPSFVREVGVVHRPRSFVASMKQLPFSDESLDGFVLLHTLDCEENPQDAIREVARVIRPGGQIIIVGFNPASAFGWARYVPGLVSQVPRKAQFLRRQRLCDWLSLLQFDVEYLGGSHLFPFRQFPAEMPENNKRITDGSVWRAARIRLGKTFRERFGGIYCLRVRKTQCKGILVGRILEANRPVWGRAKPTVAVSRETDTAKSTGVDLDL